LLVDISSLCFCSNFEDGEHQDALDILLEKRPLPSSYKLDTKVKPHKKMDKLRSTLTSLFVFLFALTRPSSRSGIFALWAMIWMAAVFIVFTLFRLDPERIVNVPVLKWNHVKVKEGKAKDDGEDADDGGAPKASDKGKEKEDKVDLSQLTEDDLKDE